MDGDADDKSVKSMDSDEKAFQEHKKHVAEEKSKGMGVMSNMADVVKVRRCVMKSSYKR